MEWIAGIDAGGTRTRALVAPVEGAGGGYGEAGPGNPAALGIEVAAAACRTALDAALRAAGLPQARVDRLVVCAAGAGRPREQAGLAAALQAAGASVRVWPDAEAGLATGSPDGTGVCLVAGTGALAYGRDVGGRTARAGGWGYLLGDEGGGFAVGREALRAALRAGEGSGPPTELLDRILGAWDLADRDALLSIVYAEGDRRERIGALAPVAAAAAAAGDAVALAILRDAGGALAELAARCAAQLGLTAPAVGCTGGLWRCAPLHAAFTAALECTLPDARPVRPEIEPVGGAALLALGPRTAPERAKQLERLRSILGETASPALHPPDPPTTPATPRPGLLLTEQRSPHVGLDTLSPLAFAQVMNAEDAQVAAAVGRALPRIAEAIARIQAALRSGRRLIYVGAGTSGRLGV
ncbi:MAG TPA: BadF/BadG/BcrA/BcrD ATPase family protein, partial [Limnochordia bacterium]|nr:BadF/BadG/BcrA/BcrD ATPase family protein [Limnochordia bacterium]